MKKGLFSIGFLFMLTGCSLFQSNTSIMKPPELPVKQQKVKEAINKYVPSQAEWVSPIEEKQANKILEADLDSDGTKELIVFYRLPDQTSQIEASVLKEENDGWKEIIKLKDIGRKLHKVEFTDVNDDGIKEILIGFSFSEDASDKALIVFEISTSKPKKIMETQYSTFFSGTFNQDNKGKIILSTLVRNQEHKVRLYEFKKNEANVLDELELDMYVSYTNTIAGSLSPLLKGMILDTAVGAHSSESFIIGVEDDKLIKIIPENLEVNEIFRTYFVNSEDTNGDGIIEFALQKEGSNENLSYAVMPYINEYYQLNDQLQAELVNQYYRNYSYRYRLQFPKDWPPVKITESEDERYVTFLSIEDDRVLFDINVLDKGQLLPKGWNILYKSNQFTYVTKSSPEVGMHFEIIE
ncbi:hypothetical protein WAK64_18435 [Bacillus spongiae]|uniref:VCBS repeat-containing protein n=1 Tax=Bacillus spongiae TaxID=2683610 RepID=A0ABU8HIL4_9BACI